MSVTVRSEIARIAAEALERWEAGQDRAAIPRSDLHREVVRFRASIGTGGQMHMPGLAAVAQRPHGLTGRIGEYRSQVLKARPSQIRRYPA